jgi:hypothetical protein
MRGSLVTDEPHFVNNGHRGDTPFAKRPAVVRFYTHGSLVLTKLSSHHDPGSDDPSKPPEAADVVDADRRDPGRGATNRLVNTSEPESKGFMKSGPRDDAEGTP